MEETRQLVESVLPELIQIQRHALDAAAHHMGVRFFEIVCELADRHFRPQIAEGVVSLVHQLHCVPRTVPCRRSVLRP